MRPLKSLFAAALLAAALLPGVAQAQAPQRVGKWDITSNPSGAGCSASVNDLGSGATRQTMVLIVVSYLHDLQRFVLVVGGQNWDFFTPGRHYDIALRFDGSPPLVFSMEALQKSNVMLGSTHWPTLFEKLAGARVLAIGQGDRIFATLPIDGGAQAMAALLDCQARHERSAKPQAAPPQSSPQAPPQSPRPASPPPPAAQKKTGVWKSVGNWTLAMLEGSDSCSIDNVDRGRSDTRLDLDWLDNGFVMIARNAAWTHLTPETSHDVTLRFHPGGAYQTRPRADRLRGTPLLGWVDVKPAFFEDFARASRLTIEHQGSVIGSVDLAGSAAALREKEACDRAWAAKKPPALLPPAAPQAPPHAGPAREAAPPSETNPLR